MTTPEQTQQTGSRLLEANRFAEAVTYFRKHAKLGAPSGRDLANLCIAEDQERLSFLRDICDTHPDNFDCRLSEINELIRLGYSAIGFNKASQMLERFNSDKETFLLKKTRLKAGRLSARFAFWDSDFVYCWNSSVRAVERFHAQLVREISSIDSIEGGDSLRALMLSPHVPCLVRSVVEKKIEQLTALASYIAEAEKRCEGAYHPPAD